MNLNHLDVWAHFAPMFHLVDAFAVYAIAMVGGRHVILPSFSALDALLTIEQEQVTVVNMASTMVAMLVNNPLIEILDLCSLRVLSCGGSPQTPAVIIRAISVFGCEFFSSYGMTECCGKISMSILPKNMNNLGPQEQLELVCTSGRPFSMVDVRVVDETGTDVTRDGITVGEVWVRGETVFDGYCNLPEANKESFFDGWFKTGDLAVISSQNYLTVVDRKKDMLLVGGENVYTTEVEEVLTAHPAIHHAAVFGIPDELMGDLVAAAVTTIPSFSLPLSKNEVTKWCSEHLAEYKVPVEILLLDKLPTTATGKHLKKELQRMIMADRAKQVPPTVQEVIPFSQGLVNALSGYLQIHTFKDLESFEKYKWTIAKNMTYLIVADDAYTLSAIAGQSLGTLSHAVIFLTVPLGQMPTHTLLENINEIASQLKSLLIFQNPEFWWMEKHSICLKAMLAIVQDTMPHMAGLIQLPQLKVPSTLALEYSSLEEMTELFENEIQDHVMSHDDDRAWQDSESWGRILQVSSNDVRTSFDVPNPRHHPYSQKEHQPNNTVVIKVIKDIILSSLGILDEISDAAPLMDAGVNSILAVQLVSALEDGFGTQLPGTLVFDYPSISDIARYIVENINASVDANIETDESLSIAKPVKAVDICHGNQKDVPLCIVTSEAHEVPGGSLNIQSRHGNDRISLVPLERWNIDYGPLDIPSEFNLQFGSFLEDVYLFDANLFSVSPTEALLMDPQQRLMMLKFLEALVDHNAKFNASKSTGIFVGVSQLEYARIAYETRSTLNAYYATGSHLSVTSGRLSYTHGFKGPAVTIDTACSSSLVTTHLALQSLFDGECKVASTLGVNLALVHSWTQACLRAGMLAQDGRCKTLDASADGYVRAEAVGALLLTLFSRECLMTSPQSRSGSGVHSPPRPLALISGTSVNQDGRSSSLTAPNGPAQQEVILGAMKAASVVGSDISSLQMHGTGTPLGDPIELGAASAVLLRRGTTRNSSLQLSGAKSFVGHGEPAAGMVGLTRLVISLENLSSDYFITLRTVNSYVSDAISNSMHSDQICIAREVGPYSLPASKTHGGVSAFAFQGTNAHAIVSKDFAEENDMHLNLSNPLTNSLDAFSLHMTRYCVLPQSHTLVQQFSSCRPDTRGLKAVFEGNLTAPRVSKLYSDHQILNKALFPAAGMVEMVLQSGMTVLEHALQTSFAVSDVVISSPLILAKSTERWKQVEILRCCIDVSNGSFFLSHYQHNAASSENAFGNISKDCKSSRNHDGSLTAFAKLFCDSSLESKMLEKGTPFGGVICNPSFFTDGYILPPPVLDANFHLGVAAPECGAKVPISIECCALSPFLLKGSVLGSKWFASTTSAYDSLTSNHDVASFNLEGPNGTSFAQVSRLGTKIVSQRPSVLDHNSLKHLTVDYLYDIDLRVIDKRIRSNSFCSLELQNIAYVRILSNQADLCASLRLDTLPCTAGAIALEMIQVIQSDRKSKGLKTKILDTMGDLKLEHEYSNKKQALQAGSIEGLLRVTATETSLDLDLTTFQPQSNEIDDNSMQYEDSVPNLREQNGSVAVPRLRKSKLIIPAADQLQIRPKPRGSLYNLRCIPFYKNLCKRDNVQVSIKAVGINFRDVLNILGMYPGDPGPPGSDCAGIIVATGSSVSHFKHGDAVFGFAHGCFGTSVECSANNLVNMPDNVSFLEASTVPTVFTTAHIALEREACLKEGQSILVHAAAGGVGLAAIQLANLNRAKVVATAGVASKRVYVRSLGIQHVIGSRDTCFVSDVCILSGADVVLNSLTSTGMVAGSIASLCIGGKFIEISKREIWSAARGLQDRPDLQFSLLAIDFLPKSVIQSTLKAIARMLGSGTILPLKNICHSIGNASSALRQLSKASHVGKVVTASLSSNVSKGFLKHPKGGIAITGGSGGLALIISEWLTKRYDIAFSHLISRSGRIINKKVPSILLYSNTVTSCALGDVGTASDALSVLDPIENGLSSPIQFLFHASGILQDALLDKQSAESFRKCFAPKIGAVERIDFVGKYSSIEGISLFSSVASLLGGAGQANYAAANAAFDAWSSMMQVCGFHSISVQWGAWASIGMVTESVLHRLQRTGQGSISADQALATLSILLGGCNTHAQPVLTVNDFDWSTYLKSSCPPLFEEFKSDNTFASWQAHLNSVKKSKFRWEDSQSTSLQAIREIVHQQVESAIVQVLGTRVGENEPLMSAGLDSLGSVEFTNILANNLGIQVPGTLIFDYPSMDLVISYLVSQIGNDFQANFMSHLRCQETLEADYTIDFAGLDTEIDAVRRLPTIVIASAAVRGLISHNLTKHMNEEVSDAIQRIPNNRWDLDIVPKVTQDALTIPAQVRKFENSIMVSSQNANKFYLLVFKPPMYSNIYMLFHAVRCFHEGYTFI